VGVASGADARVRPHPRQRLAAHLLKRDLLAGLRGPSHLLLPRTELSRTGGPSSNAGDPNYYEFNLVKALMTRREHDSERAALIYQREARGADHRNTDAIDFHVQAERDDQGDDDDDDGSAGALVRRRPGPCCLTGVPAETPGSSMTSRVRPPGTFCCARCPAVTVCLKLEGRVRTLSGPSPDRAARFGAPLSKEFSDVRA
jgi:hypothetical protein